MKILKKANVHSEILKTHDICWQAIDTLGRKWPIAAWPKNSGVVCFFNKPSELHKWERQVLQVRKMLL